MRTKSVTESMRVKMRIHMRSLETAQRILLVGGLALLGFCALAYISGHMYSRMALSKFASNNTASVPDAANDDKPNSGPIDFRLWSEKRIHAYQESLERFAEMPEAVLRIEKLGLEVPLFKGTDDITLNRGVGRILGTARPGEPGNIGIAGHRDGFFRGLKDVVVGDSVQLKTPKGTDRYIIDSITIVGPNDVGVLRNDSSPAVTLVTCYPFYYVGNAPQRYIVHATLESAFKTENQLVKTSFKTKESVSKENTNEPKK